MPFQRQVGSPARAVAVPDGTDRDRGGLFKFSPFMLEWMAGGRPPNQIPISSVCNCHCLFCSNDLNPFSIFGHVFRDVDDIKTQIGAMERHDDPIQMSDSLPGRISEGEAFIHPRFFEILDLVRSKFFYNTLCFTTNGSMLEEGFVRRLMEYLPIEINVSMHSTRPDLWSKVFARPEAAARVAVSAVPLLGRFGIGLSGTIVPMPRLCGWEDIERTYEYLVTHGAKKMTLYWPGHSLRTSPEIAANLSCPLDEFADFAERMRRRFHVPQNEFPDMRGPLDVSVATIVDLTLHGNPAMRGGPYDPVVWLASEAAHDRLEKAVARESNGAANRHRVVAVKNLTYGGNIMAAGLLMVEDFVRTAHAALETWPDTQLFLLPIAPFDRLRRDLKGTPAHRFSEEVGRPGWLVGDDGGIETLLTLRLGTRSSLDVSELDELMRRFDEALLADGAASMVATFPVTTPIGLLDEGQFQQMSTSHRQRVVGSTPAARHFEVLSPATALSIEVWRLRDSPRSLQRWTRLVETEQGWRVASIEEGEV